MEKGVKKSNQCKLIDGPLKEKVKFYLKNMTNQSEQIRRVEHWQNRRSWKKGLVTVRHERSCSERALFARPACFLPSSSACIAFYWSTMSSNSDSEGVEEILDKRFVGRDKKWKEQQKAEVIL